ncbi:hypothetical protein BJ912DRAFT_928874 [Pholiota molesta]|nr:hypothetical protein BJ912DRAFT_928874 [Pholiota molesta]
MVVIKKNLLSFLAGRLMLRGLYKPSTTLWFPQKMDELNYRWPELDVPRIWCTGEDDVNSAQKMAMEEAQQDILGPQELGGLKEVEYNEEMDNFIGGSAVERHCRNGDVSRSHTYGPTLQKQMCVIAPPSLAKLALMDMDLDENLESRKSLLKAASDISTSTLLLGPPKTVLILEKQSDMINAFKCGSNTTKSFTTLQLNLVGAQTEAGALEQLGRVGIKHYDKHDHVDVPNNFEPSVMFILWPMMFTRLAKFRGMKFSGLHLHGGTPPTAPINTTLSGWEPRAVCMSYRTTIAAEGRARYPLCASMTNREAIYSMPEMQFPEYYYAENTMASKGLSTVQHLLEMSISFVHADGKRQTVVPWTYPPGWRAKNASRNMNQVGVEVVDLVDQIPYCRQAQEESKAHNTTLGQFLPHVIAHDKVPTMTDEDIENIIKQGPTETSLADTVQGQIVPTEEGEVNPSDDEGDKDKSEDVPVCNPAFDALVDTERNTKVIMEFARKKAESAQRRKLAKLMRETKEHAGKGKKNAHGKGKGPGKGRRKNHGPGKGAAGKGSGTGKGPSKASVPIIGPPTSTPESEDEFHPTPSRTIAARTSYARVKVKSP